MLTFLPIHPHCQCYHRNTRPSKFMISVYPPFIFPFIHHWFMVSIRIYHKVLMKKKERYILSHHTFTWLVGGLNPSEKYESQLGWLCPIYGKIKLMFQTTNQILSHHIFSYEVLMILYHDGVPPTYLSSSPHGIPHSFTFLFPSCGVIPSRAPGGVFLAGWMILRYLISLISTNDTC